MSATLTDVVEGVENKIEFFHVSHTEPFLLDVTVVRLDIYILVEAAAFTTTKSQGRNTTQTGK